MKDSSYKNNIISNEKGEFGAIRYSTSFQKFSIEALVIAMFVMKHKVVDPQVDDHWKEEALLKLKATFNPKDPLGRESLGAFDKVDGSVFDGENYDEILSQLLICRSVDNYLTYLRDVLTEIVLVRPEILKSKEVERLDFILSYSTYEDLMKAIVEKRIEELSYKSFDDMAKYFETRLGIKPFVEFDFDYIKRKIKERNLLVHNRGVINKRFVNEFALSEERVGQKLEYTYVDILRLVIQLNNEVVFLDSKISYKFPIKTLTKNAVSS